MISGRSFLYCLAAAFFVVLLNPSVSRADSDCPSSDHEEDKEFSERWFSHSKSHHDHDDHHEYPKNYKSKSHDDDRHGYRKDYKYKKSSRHKWKRRAGPFWWRTSFMAERLSLSEQQISKLDGIAVSYTPRISEAYHEMYEAKLEFNRAVADPESSSKKIKAAADKKYKAWVDKKMIKLDMLLEMRKVLTPEQIRDLTLLKMKNK